MDPIYVFGHRNPDTDSVVSAMSYAALMNALGEGEYIPARLGHLNDESSFLLKRFGFEPPLYMTTVRTQVRDIEIDHPPRLSTQVPMRRAWELLRGSDAYSAIPVTDDDGHLYGLATSGSVAAQDMDSLLNPYIDNVPVFNLLSALEGRVMNNDDDMFDTISGEVFIALPENGSILRGVHEGAVVICGHQPEVIEKALEMKASCIILCQTDLAEHYRNISSSTCIIASPCDAYRSARMLFQAMPVGRVAQTEDLVYFHLDDFLDDVRSKVTQVRFRAYPVLDENECVVGTLSRYHLMRPRRKRVVLVDHNERSQSVDGLEQADIVAILDHHRLADVQTRGPVFMRNETVGSTTSIIATMYQEHGLMPSPKLAGLMAAAILSDTVLFKSPTCTPRDRRLAERLARIAGIDLDTLGREMFSAGRTGDKPVTDLLNSDFKEFLLGNHKIGISQISCLDSQELLGRKDEFLSEMEKMKKQHSYDMVLLMLTDVLREGTELMFIGDSETIALAFGLNEKPEDHVFLEKVVSRKKQIVPGLAALWG